MTPLEAKAAHAKMFSRLRQFIKCGACFVITAIALLVYEKDLKSINGAWGSVLFHVVGAGVAGVGLLTAWNECLSFWMAHKIRVFCDHCGKFIEDVDWTCGYCDRVNRDTIIRGTFNPYSFLRRCLICGQAPHALECPHCEKMIYLDELHINENPARMKDREPLPQVSPDETHKREVQELQRKKEIARLNAELTKEEAALELVRRARKDRTEKPYGEKLEEEFANFRDKALAVEMITKRELERAEKEYQNDPDLLERYKATVQSWREENV